MPEKQLPEVGGQHYGARARWDNFFNGTEMTVEEALADAAHRTAPDSKGLTKSWKMKFRRGWTYGGFSYYSEQLIALAIQELTLNELDMLAQDIKDLFLKYVALRKEREARNKGG